MTHEKEFLEVLRKMATAMEYLRWSIPDDHGISYELRGAIREIHTDIQNLENALNAEEKSET